MEVHRREQRDSYLSISGASKSYAKFTALKNVSMDIMHGEFICFLGPSGCGKTTLLRSIAGLEKIDKGHIVQDGVDITNLPTSSRDFGILFQSYALFPNLTVFGNIAYGLVAQRQARKKINERVAELSMLVGLGGQEEKFPSQLSGGQQQRVALARALAPMPGLLLLDEPLSALDAKVRVHLRREIKMVHREVGLTTIMVTHDREEALTMADRIAVMRSGEIEQMSTPEEIYDSPKTPFVADFISNMNLISSTRVADDRVRCGGGIELRSMRSSPEAGRHPICGFKPEDLKIFDHSSKNKMENCFKGRIREIENLGGMLRFYLETHISETEIRLDSAHSDYMKALRCGDDLDLFVPAKKLLLLRGET